VEVGAGNLDRARALFEEALAIEREFGHAWGEALVIGNLGALALAEGDLAAARSGLGESIRRLRGLGDSYSLLEAIERSAGLAAAEGAIRRAVRLAAAAATQRNALGEPLTPSEQAIVDRYLAPARAALDPAAFAATWAEGERLTFDEALDASVWW